MLKSGPGTRAAHQRNRMTPRVPPNNSKTVTLDETPGQMLSNLALVVYTGTR
jgi:hypothetical protein